MMQTRRRISWPNVGIVFLGIIIASTILPSRQATALDLPVIEGYPQPAPQQQETPVADAGEDVYQIPFQWQGDATVPVSDLSSVAPPLEVVASDGDFSISYVPTDAGDVIRILPDRSGGQPGRSLQLAWRLTESSEEPAIPTGSLATLTVWARLFSPPDGPRLVIRDQVEGWGSSSTPMQDIAWTQHEVTRAIAEDATEVHFGIDWDVPLDNAWLEIRELEVSFQPDPADGSPVALSPTDTPTPAGTPTPVVTPTPTPTNTPEIPPTPVQLIVTSTPTPVDVFVAATRAAIATDWANVLGAATATPDYMVTATFTPPPTNTPTPIVVTNTPAPGNAATATTEALYAAAVAFTTGTPTPFPDGAVVLVATNTPTPKAKPSKTPTPILRYVDDLVFPTATPTLVYPEALMGKILFLSDYLGSTRRPKTFMINPDGTGLALLTSQHFYNRAKERDAYSADKRYYAYALREPLGDRTGRIQVYYDDDAYNSTGHQLTYFGAGTAWSPTWSPVDDGTVALVSSDTKNDEIWIVRRNEWPPTQITKNEWEWDKSPSFSPDGTEIVFESNRANGTRQLWIMDASGDNPRQLTWFPHEAWDPVWVKYPDS